MNGNFNRQKICFLAVWNTLYSPDHSIFKKHFAITIFILDALLYFVNFKQTVLGTKFLNPKIFWELSPIARSLKLGSIRVLYFQRNELAETKGRSLQQSWYLDEFSFSHLLQAHTHIELLLSTTTSFYPAEAVKLLSSQCLFSSLATLHVKIGLNYVICIGNMPLTKRQTWHRKKALCLPSDLRLHSILWFFLVCSLYELR